MKAWASRGFYVACYFISWGWFALVGLIFNMACAPLLLVPARNRIGIWVRILTSFPDGRIMNKQTGDKSWEM